MPKRKPSHRKHISKSICSSMSNKITANRAQCMDIESSLTKETKSLRRRTPRRKMVGRQNTTDESYIRSALESGLFRVVLSPREKTKTKTKTKRKKTKAKAKRNNRRQERNTGTQPQRETDRDRDRNRDKNIEKNAEKRYTKRRTDRQSVWCSI